uniref:Nuclear mitotic apparatus protein 1 N-terminal hook domain-containing protein n=1 Tax=Accipiter nisus TaxID=211598 RepID=A0A8B9RZD0_9AVES
MFVGAAGSVCACSQAWRRWLLLHHPPGHEGVGQAGIALPKSQTLARQALLQEKHHSFKSLGKTLTQPMHSSSHRSEEGESVLEQPLPERISFIRGFLQKHCKHKSATENLVSAQKLLEGEELALAKVAVLLLYHTSMSCKSPREWYEFDYKTQVIPSGLPLRTRGVGASGGACRGCSETCPRTVPRCWLRITELCGVPLYSTLSGSPSSPMGDVMQTPQFQLRRLKKQLAVERENRDELEVELAENRKLITEKGQLLVGCSGAWGGLSRAGTSPGFCAHAQSILPDPR